MMNKNQRRGDCSSDSVGPMSQAMKMPDQAPVIEASTYQDAREVKVAKGRS